MEGIVAKRLDSPYRPGVRSPDWRKITNVPAVRAVVECAGIANVLTKSIGNNNAMNVIKATMDGLKQLASKEELEQLRGTTIEVE